MTVCVRVSDGLPRCEGWLEKCSVGRGFFSRKGWRRRYTILTHEGVGYMHQPPPTRLQTLPLRRRARNGKGGVEKTGELMRPSAARCFVPFGGFRKSNGEFRLRPVYFLRHVTPSMHPELFDVDSSPSSSGLSASDSLQEYHHFALSFEERNKRFFLLFRTPDREEYRAWALTFALYVSAGSVSTVVPVPHPLEAPHYRRRGFFQSKRAGQKNAKRGAVDIEPSVFYPKDPDPCSAAGLKKICGRVREWDEGALGRWRSRWERAASSSDVSLLRGPTEEGVVERMSLTAELDDLCDEGPSDTSLSEL